MSEDAETELEAEVTEEGDTAGDDADVSNGSSDDDSTDTISEGDYVKVHFTLRTAENGSVIDTTLEDVADEADLDVEDPDFEPRTLVLGEGHLFETAEEAILGESVGASGSVTVDAGEAFGEHDPDAVETVSAERIPEDDRYPGAHVHIDDRHGYVETIIGGRARVDFNHPLAGEDIDFEYEIVGRVEDRLERASAVFEMFLDVSPNVWIETEEVEEEVLVESDDDDGDDTDDDADADGDDDAGADGDDDADDGSTTDDPETRTEVREIESLYVESTPELTMNQQWMFSKQQIAQEVIDAVDVERIVVQEIIEGMGPMGMPGMGGDLGGIEEALEEADVDTEDIVDELVTGDDAEE